MTTQTESGKAFEYALAKTIHDKIRSKQNVTLRKNVTYENAKKLF